MITFRDLSKSKSIDDIDKNNSTKVDLKFLYCKLDIQCDTAKRTFIQVDVDRFNAVNMNERRNYHMWKYIILLFNSDFIDDEDKMYLFVYACYLFSNCLWDYSAYNFIVNFYKKLPLTKNNLLNLISYNKQTENVFTKDEYEDFSVDFMIKINNKWCWNGDYASDYSHWMIISKSPKE